MALSQSVLKNNLLHAFEEALKIKESTPGCPPKVPTKVAELIAGAYDSYARSVSPGPLKFATPPKKAVLVQFFTQPNSSGYAPGITAYWTPVTFAGPGLIPVNPILPATLAALPGLISKIMSVKANSASVAADQIASILHKATVSLKVLTTTTTVPPVVVPVPFA